MSSHEQPSGKPRVAEQDALALLREHFTAPIEGLSMVPGGQVAQIYAFSVNSDEYILRFAPHMGANLEKELSIHRLLATSLGSSLVPIPPVLHVGRLGTLHFAISRRMQGTPLSELPPPESAATIPELLETLDAIHAVDVRATAGSGLFGDDGTGLFPSWRASLAAIHVEEPAADSSGKRRSVFETTFLERDLWDTIYARMIHLLDFCPEDRYLVHGDYGFDNVLAADGRITAVLDWVNAQYGDFLYDVAWLDFWPSGLDLRDLCAAHYAERGITPPNYAERILCYQCAIALNTLPFFAKRRNEDVYRWVRQRILSRLG